MTPSYYLYQIQNLKILPGMSGGLTITSTLYDGTDFEIVGLNSEFTPEQDTAYVIPIHLILNWLKNPTSSQLDTKSSNKREGAGGNGRVGGGNNEFQDLQPKKSSLQNLFEPDEGINTDSGYLLGIKPFQIDGHDDFERVSKLDVKNYVYRDRSGYPNIEIRKTILERLKIELRFPISTLKTYNNSELQGLTEVHSTSTAAQLFVNRDIRLQNGNSLIIFQPTFSKENKIVYLDVVSGSGIYQNLKLRLTCENKSYLKLICKDDENNTNFYLSLSKSMDNSSSFTPYTFRFIWKNKNQFYYLYNVIQ